MEWKRVQEGKWENCMSTRTTTLVTLKMTPNRRPPVPMLGFWPPVSLPSSRLHYDSDTTMPQTGVSVCILSQHLTEANQ
jgi:hypothetical protein